MHNKSLLFILVCILLSSCSISRYVDFDRKLTKIQIEEDISFVKAKLQKEHYNLNWEKREIIIVNQLDSLSNNIKAISVGEFKSKLESILKSIDDGHTGVIGENKLYKQKESKSKFGCNLLNDGTLYLKVPNFTDRRGLKNALSNFDDILRKNQPDRILIDFSNNRGGNIDYVYNLLQKTIKNETCFCEKYVLKLSSGYFGWIQDGAFILKKGFRKKDGYLVKPCKKVKPQTQINDIKTFLLIDSTIISASMLAAYHLKNDGYTIIGSTPTSLFNTFGNVKSFKTPNAKLFLNVSTARITINDNYTDRSRDMLIPDISISNASLPQILERIGLE